MASQVKKLFSEALPDGTWLLGDEFTILHIIGKGGFGITYLASDNYLDRKVVIKECFPHVICCRHNAEVHAREESDKENLFRITRMFVREARRIAKMEHPNIIGVQRIFEENNTAYIVLDFVAGPTLQDMIASHHGSAFSPAEVRELLLKLLDAVQEVHRHDFLHRDISPDNIMIDKWGAPVLIDFGAARERASRESRELSTLLVVKEGYSPQELYFMGGKQSHSSDLYALAATFYHLITGEGPPNSQLRAADIASGCPDPCLPLTGRFEKYDPILLQSIDQSMQVLPRDRIQSAQIWKNLIMPDIKTTQRNELRPVDKALAKTISKVVSETNKNLAEVPVIPADHNPQTMPTRHAVRLDWIEEFNAETNELTHDKGGVTRMTDDNFSRTNTPNYRKYREPHRRRLKATTYLAVFFLIIAQFVLVLSKP